MGKVQEAKEKLLEQLEEHRGKFAVGIGADHTLEVRLYDSSIEDEFPSEVDGVTVNVVLLRIPKAR